MLIEMLGKAEFKTRKEAAWAITNSTSGGTPDQIRFLVNQGCIAPLCDLLTVMDGKIVQVALTGLENILRLGEQDAKQSSGSNPYAVIIEECYGMILYQINLYSLFNNSRRKLLSYYLNKTCVVRRFLQQTDLCNIQQFVQNVCSGKFAVKFLFILKF